MIRQVTSLSEALTLTADAAHMNSTLMQRLILHYLKANQPLGGGGEQSIRKYNKSTFYDCIIHKTHACVCLDPASYLNIYFL